MENTNDVKVKFIELEKRQNPLAEFIARLEKTPTKIYNPNNDVIEGRMFYGFRTIVEEEPVDVMLFEDLTHYPVKVKDGGLINGIEINGQKIRFRDNLIEEENQMSNKGIAEFLKGKKADTQEIYKRIKNKLKQYIDFQKEEEYDLLVNWVIHTYLINLFGSTAYIKLGGNLDVGKSTVMKVCSKLCFKGKFSVIPTSAVLYRSLNNSQNTLFVDEFENQNDENKEAIMAVLNAGYTKEGCIIERTDTSKKGNFGILRFRAFSPKMFAGIKDIHISTLKSRCLELNMFRTTRTNLKNIDLIDEKEGEDFREIRDDIFIFCLQNYKTIIENFGKINGSMSSRKGQILKPLLAIEMVFKEDSAIRNYYNQTIKEELHEDIIRDWNYMLLETLYGFVNNNKSELTIQEITESFKPNLPENQILQFNPNRVGIMLKKLGLNVNKRRTGKSTLYSFTKDQIIQKLKQWNFWEVFLEQNPDFKERAECGESEVSVEIVEVVDEETTHDSEKIEKHLTDEELHEIKLQYNRDPNHAT